MSHALFFFFSASSSRLSSKAQLIMALGCKATSHHGHTSMHGGLFRLRGVFLGSL